jgi:hypothetical protein
VSGHDEMAALQTYLSPDYSLKSYFVQHLQTQLDTQGANAQSEFDQYVNEMYAKSFDDLRNQTPTFNAAGNEATYMITRHLGDVEFRSELIMIRIDGLWYMKEWV